MENETVNGKWSFNKSEDGNWVHDLFDTKEEAVEAGLEYAKEDGSWSDLFVGQCQEIPVMSPLDADSVIEKAAEMIDDNYGGDFDPGSSFLEGIGCGDYGALQELLDEAFRKWVKERNIRCNSFVIENIEQISLSEEGAAE